MGSFEPELLAHGNGDALAGAEEICPGIVFKLCQAFEYAVDVPLVAALDLRHFLPGDRHRDRQAIPRSRRIGAGRGCAQTVAQVVDEDPTDPVFGPETAVKRSGISLAMCSTTARLNALTSSQPSLRVIGTTTCMPLPPLVLRNDARPSSSSRV